MDNNGYIPSIMDTRQGVCYRCGRKTETARHEIYFGNPNRKTSKRNGFWVNLCPECHAFVHSDRETDLELKSECERRFLETHSLSEFMALIGRNYED